MSTEIIRPDEGGKIKKVAEDEAKWIKVNDFLDEYREDLPMQYPKLRFRIAHEAQCFTSSQKGGAAAIDGRRGQRAIFGLSS